MFGKVIAVMRVRWHIHAGIRRRHVSPRHSSPPQSSPLGRLYTPSHRLLRVGTVAEEEKMTLLDSLASDTGLGHQRGRMRCESMSQQVRPSVSGQFHAHPSHRPPVCVSVPK
jgi:hypothetical protein